MTQTCKQKTFTKNGRPIERYLPHIVPDCTGDPNNGYAICENCGQKIYVGTGQEKRNAADAKYMHYNRFD